MIRYLYPFFFFFFHLSAAQIETFYGPLDVHEPILLELIEHPMFQRLKLIHQYGIAYYTTHPEEYSRYDHSLGVFAILRAGNASLEEQIAGLLHDVSHTVFSHVGDWIFGNEYHEKDYQSSIHTLFLKQSGLEKILNKYGFHAIQLLPTEEAFPALEQLAPNLCADRLDYNIQGAYHQGFITYQEALEIFNDLQFIEGHWILTRTDHLKKLVRFSIFMTQNCWGSPTNYLISRWLADAILRGVEINLITYNDIHFATDDFIWNRLNKTQDPLIQAKMNLILHSETTFHLTCPEKADFIIYSKFRGIDPWVYAKEGLVRFTTTDPILSEEYQSAKIKVLMGWPIAIDLVEAMEHSQVL